MCTPTWWAFCQGVLGRGEGGEGTRVEVGDKFPSVNKGVASHQQVTSSLMTEGIEMDFKSIFGYFNTKPSESRAVVD